MEELKEDRTTLDYILFFVSVILILKVFSETK